MISLEEAKAAFYLDPTSPSGLRWNIDKYSGKHLHIQSIFKGSAAGSKGKTYWNVMLDYNTTGVHCIVYMLLYNLEYTDFDLIDHLNGDGHDNSVHNLRASTVAVNSRNKKISSANNSGTTGVFVHTSRGKKYVRAQWYNLEGKRCMKNFSYNLYGELGAWDLAVQARDKAITALQAEGAGYTERHGKLVDIPQ